MTPLSAYFSPRSRLGLHRPARLQDIAAAAGDPIDLLPVDDGRIFAQSDGLPLPKRAPQRQADRLAELARFRRPRSTPCVWSC